MKFSVLMSVYKNEKVDYFKAALDSVLNQSVLPDEIVLVRDGEVSSMLQSVIDDYLEQHRAIFTYIPLAKNGGLGNALNIGLGRARNELIARMDTDDICIPKRFEWQVEYMQKHPEIDVCGGQIIEFIEIPERPEGRREVPIRHNEISEFIKSRNPFNHMTVMFRKSAVVSAGSYIELSLVEDYYLWCRMFLNGARFANLEDVLVYARIGKDMYRRRGGYKYFRSWLTLEKFKIHNNITTTFQFIRTITMRFVVQVLMPNRLRGWILKNFSRK